MVIMTRILSISYSDSVLKTRQMLLEQSGLEVKSAKRLEDALALCARQSSDLMIVDDSVPLLDKQYICARLKLQCNAPLLVLLRPSEPPMEYAEYNIEGGDPHAFVEVVTKIVKRKGTSA